MSKPSPPNSSPRDVPAATPDPGRAPRDPKNPHDICIWADPAGCAGCEIRGELQCHWEKKYTAWFAVGMLVIIGAEIVGFVRAARAGAGWAVFGAVAGQIAYALVFFLLWEPKMLCRHCPYYAEGDTRTLHCYANAGFPLREPFYPAPMTRSEQLQFAVGALLFVGYPFVALLLLQQWGAAVGALVGIVAWYLILLLVICPRCVNFSCPFNRVPRAVRDAFLRRNPGMRAAWEAAGYEIPDE